MAGLMIVEPTTILRDWVRDQLDLAEVWAGGWPQSNTATTGIVLEVISSSLNVAVTTWATQWDCYAPSQPAAAQMAADLAVILVETPPRTVLGANVHGQLVYGGAVESSVSVFPVDEEDPDVHRHTLLVDLAIVAVPIPPLPPD